jgi:hypothetical protein
MRPDHAEFLRNFYAVSFRNEHPVTRRVIEAIPDDHADYRPDDIVKSARGWPLRPNEPPANR